MQAGKLRHRITIQQLGTGSPSQNAAGEPDDFWADVATVWASVEPLRGHELFAAQQITSEVTGQIRIRYSIAVSVVTSGMRVKFGARYYDILAVVNTGENNVELVLSVREGPNNG